MYILEVLSVDVVPQGNAIVQASFIKDLQVLGQKSPGSVQIRGQFKAGLALTLG